VRSSPLVRDSPHLSFDYCASCTSGRISISSLRWLSDTPHSGGGAKPQPGIDPWRMCARNSVDACPRRVRRDGCTHAATAVIYRRPSPGHQTHKDLYLSSCFKSSSLFALVSLSFSSHSFLDNAMWFKGLSLLSYTALLVTTTNATGRGRGRLLPSSTL
jgi:hypothetical protein